MKVEVDVLGFPSLVIHTVRVDVKQELKKKGGSQNSGAVRTSRWTSRLAVPNSPYCRCGRKAALNEHGGLKEQTPMHFVLPPPPFPLPPISPSLISLVVYVDVKYHVYLLVDTVV